MWVGNNKNWLLSGLLTAIYDLVYAVWFMRLTMTSLKGVKPVNRYNRFR